MSKVFLFVGLFVAAAAAAPVADSTALADSLNATITAPPEPAAKATVTQPARARSRASRRRAAREGHERNREERLRIHSERNAVRDSARRLDNLFFGSGTVFAIQAHDIFRDTQTTEFSPSQAMLLGYRTHTSLWLGYKTGLQYRTGFTLVSRSWEDTAAIFTFGDHSASGAGGATSAFEAHGQIIVGPLWRLVVEPGMAYTWGWHTRERIGLDEFGTQAMDYHPARHFTALSGIFGVTLYLGGRDQINPMWEISVGKILGEKAGLSYQWMAGFVLALPGGH